MGLSYLFGPKLPQFTLVLVNPLVEIALISIFFTMPVIFTFILFTKHLHNCIAIISLREVAWAQINSLTPSRAIEEPVKTIIHLCNIHIAKPVNTTDSFY
jgi:hypothetical protein